MNYTIRVFLGGHTHPRQFLVGARLSFYFAFSSIRCCWRSYRSRNCFTAISIITLRGAPFVVAIESTDLSVLCSNVIPTFALLIPSPPFNSSYLCQHGKNNTAIFQYNTYKGNSSTIFRAFLYLFMKNGYFALKLALQKRSETNRDGCMYV